MQPNASNMAEYPEFTPRGSHPATMTPLVIQPVPLTPAQANLAEVATLHGKVLEALKCDHAADPVTLMNYYKMALIRAKHLLATFDA